MRHWQTWVVLALVAVSIGVFVLLRNRGDSPRIEPIEEKPKEAATSLAPGYFEDVTPSSEINFTHRNGEEAGLATILETLGGGVALLDYDGDGLLDIFLTGGG